MGEEEAGEDDRPGHLAAQPRRHLFAAGIGGVRRGGMTDHGMEIKPS